MNRDQIVDALAGLKLFADLGRPQLEAVADTLSEESFAPGSASSARTSRARASTSSSTARPSCTSMARSGRGSARATSSARARSSSAAPPSPTSSRRHAVQTLQLAGPELRSRSCSTYPAVMYRMLQAVSRRLDLANRRD